MRTYYYNIVVRVVYNIHTRKTLLCEWRNRFFFFFFIQNSTCINKRSVPASSETIKILLIEIDDVYEILILLLCCLFTQLRKCKVCRFVLIYDVLMGRLAAAWEPGVRPWSWENANYCCTARCAYHSTLYLPTCIQNCCFVIVYWTRLRWKQWSMGFEIPPETNIIL